MEKKKMKVTTKQKNNAKMNDINGLHACITKDQDQLEKLYKKTFISANKDVSSIKKLLAKAKKQAIKAKRSKKDSPKAYLSALSGIQFLKKQLAVLKDERACIEAGYTKFNAQQRMFLQFEKQWNKKTVIAKNEKPIKRAKMITVKAIPEVVQISSA